MKKSLVISMNSEQIKELPEQFKSYFPEENKFEKISTFNEIPYDYVIVTNFKDNKKSDFEPIFKGKEEHFFINDLSYDNEVLNKICLAYNDATYTFKIDKDYKEVKSDFEFINDKSKATESFIIAEAVNICKDLINKPSNHLTTNNFAKYLKEMAKNANIEYSEINKDELVKMKAGGILAVNQGSKEDAKVAILKFSNGTTEKKYTLVGKGLIFDTGGYSIKPGNFMNNMKSDMGGAATCAAVINAVAKLNIKINLEVIIPITDNLINENAYRPDDIIEFMNGITTEILSTDAEGRLILADALVIASKEKPNLIIDIATLTGAVVAALGDKTTGVFGNDEESIKNLIKCSEECEEFAWHLPINDSHREQIKGTVATIKNAASPAGASTAAAFLEKFVDDNNWIHLDIAGSSWNDTTGATGSMVKPLVKFFSEIEGK